MFTILNLFIAEETAEGSQVGTIPTKPGFTYRLNNEERLFSLDSISGVLTTRGRLDREAIASGQIDLIVLSSSPTYPIEVSCTHLFSPFQNTGLPY